MKKLLLIIFIMTTTILLIINIAGCKNSAKPTENNTGQDAMIYNSKPCFSPDSSRVAFVSNRDGNYEIYMVGIDGSDLKRITDSEGDENWPDLSPDGTKIVFSYPKYYPSYRILSEDSEIYIINSDGSGRKKLTDNRVGELKPCFSPDGTEIAFVSTRDGNAEIYIMNIDGSDQRRITHYPVDSDDYFGNSNPCFSPDGTKIAFTSIRKEADSNDENGYGEPVKDYYSDIYLINVDGSGEKRITSHNEDEYMFEPSDYYSNLFFSPDDARIAYKSSSWSKYGIVTMNIDGSGYEKLFGVSEDDRSFCLSPDWSKIAIELSSKGVSDIYLYDIDDELREHGINLSNNPASD